MRYTFLLAWRYLTHHRLRTALLVLCIALTFLLPMAVHLLLDRYGEALMARAEATPLVVGAKGSRYDLILNTLYFKGRIPTPLTMAEADLIQDGGLATPIPVLTGYSAHGYPVVGVSPDYYSLRGLVATNGSVPLMLGEATLGSRVAEELGLSTGGTLLTDRGSLYDLTMAYPLRMRIAGVFAPTGTADDGAVFVGVKTGWVIDGIGHGHDAPSDLGDAATEKATGKGNGVDTVLRREEDNVVMNAAVYEYTEITDANIDQFHFHGEISELPLTAVIVLPNDAKSATLLKGRYRVSPTAQLLVPTDVVDELLGFVFRIKVFFDANVALVTAATTLFLILTVLLTVKVRQREIETLSKIGCSRLTVLGLLGAELSIVIVTGLALAGGCAALLVTALERGALRI